MREEKKQGECLTDVVCLGSLRCQFIYLHMKKHDTTSMPIWEYGLSGFIILIPRYIPGYLGTYFSTAMDLSAIWVSWSSKRHLLHSWWASCLTISLYRILVSEEKSRLFVWNHVILMRLLASASYKQTVVVAFQLGCPWQTLPNLQPRLLPHPELTAV